MSTARSGPRGYWMTRAGSRSANTYPPPRSTASTPSPHSATPSPATPGWYPNLN